MSVLRSTLFKGDPKLEAALNVDPGHITPGAIGEHVKKLHVALSQLLTAPAAGINEDERTAGRYGRTTSAAVLRYKTERGIVNRAYQTAPDNIVGKMTMQALDDDMVRLEAAGDDSAILQEVGWAIVDLVRHLKHRAPQRSFYISPLLDYLLEALRWDGQALAGAPRPLRIEVAVEYWRGIRDIDKYTTPPPAVDDAAAKDLVGATLTQQLAFLAALAALVAIVALLGLRRTKSGSAPVQLTKAREDVRKTAEEALLESVAELDTLDAQVAKCRSDSQFQQQNNPKCADAFRRYDLKRQEVEKTRRSLTTVVRRLTSGQTISDAADAALARQLLDEFNDGRRQLSRVNRDLVKECGCTFIRF